MKKSIAAFIILSFFATSYGQETNITIPEITKADYLKKSKKQKTIAWLMLAGGTTVGLIGLSQINLAGSDGDINNTPGTVMFFTGLGSAIASIPLFSASSRNKKRAMKLSFRPNSIPILSGKNITHKTQSSIAMKLCL